MCLHCMLACALAGSLSLPTFLVYAMAAPEIMGPCLLTRQLMSVVAATNAVQLRNVP